MQCIDSCYICTTPFQVIVATTMAYYASEEADIYIVPQFDEAKEYVIRLKTINIFRNVIIVDTQQIESYKTSKRRLFKYVGIIWNYLNIGKIAKKILLKDTLYKKILISSKANIGRIICFYHIKVMSEVAIYYFDDGEGSYDNPLLYKPKIGDLILRFLLFGKRSISLSNTIYLYSPIFYNNLNINIIPNTIKIPTWHKDPILLKAINNICDYSSLKEINENVILIDTVKEECFDNNQCKQYEKILRLIEGIFSEDLIYKKHPRDKNEEEGKINTYKYHNIPFEIICANCNINDKILITESSTSVSIPKLLFDSEPTIILLYKIVKSKIIEEHNSDKFYKALKSIYKDQSKVIIPKTEQELVSYLHLTKDLQTSITWTS